MLDKAVVAYRKPLDRPFFTVSLRDAAGRLLEPPQDTPPGHFLKAERCIAAGHAVVLRTPLQDLPGGAARCRACRRARARLCPARAGRRRRRGLLHAGTVCKAARLPAERRRGWRRWPGRPPVHACVGLPMQQALQGFGLKHACCDARLQGAPR